MISVQCVQYVGQNSLQRKDVAIKILILIKKGINVPNEITIKFTRGLI